MKKYILYAENDQEDFMLLTKAFEETGQNINLINVPSGYDVLKFLRSLDEPSFPSLILMEWKMPLLNGKETAGILKEHDKFKSIPVVFFSTTPNPADEQFINKVSLEFIHKPYSYSEWLFVARRLAVHCSFAGKYSYNLTLQA